MRSFSIPPGLGLKQCPQEPQVQRLTSGGREDARAVHSQADAAVFQELLLGHSVQQRAV